MALLPVGPQLRVAGRPSPWGSRQPEPFFDKQTKIYQVALKPGERSPFQPDDELYAAPKATRRQPTSRAKKDGDDEAGEEGRRPKTTAKATSRAERPSRAAVVVDLDRPRDAPDRSAGPGRQLQRPRDRRQAALLPVASTARRRAKRALKTLADRQQEARARDVHRRSAELRAVARRQEAAGAQGRRTSTSSTPAPRRRPRLAKTSVPLARLDVPARPARRVAADVRRGLAPGARLLLRPRHARRRLAGDAREVPAAGRSRHRPRRAERPARADGRRAVGAAHLRRAAATCATGADEVEPGVARRARSRATRRPAATGSTHIYRSRSRPARRARRRWRGPASTSTRATSSSRSTASPTLSVRRPRPAAAQPGRQAGAAAREAEGGRRRARRRSSTPISLGAEDDLRYDEWEYTRRLAVEKASNGQIGYVHLRAMGGGNIAEWTREFYPVFDRARASSSTCATTAAATSTAGSSRSCCARRGSTGSRASGSPTGTCSTPSAATWSCSCDERTASDGEAFAEGFRRLGLGKVIGTRTWGGEIWLSSSNVLVDRGIATAAETGVYGPEGAVAHRRPRRRSRHRRRQPAARDVRRARTRSSTRRSSTCRSRSGPSPCPCRRRRRIRTSRSGRRSADESRKGRKGRQGPRVEEGSQRSRRRGRSATSCDPSTL